MRQTQKKWWMVCACQHKSWDLLRLRNPRAARFCEAQWPGLGSSRVLGAVGSSSLTHFRADLPALSRCNVITSRCCFNEIFVFCTMTQCRTTGESQIRAVVTSLLPWQSPPLCLLQSLRFWDASSRALLPLFPLGFIKIHLHPVGDFPDPGVAQEQVGSRLNSFPSM